MGLKELRLNTGLSQAELARISGINLRSLQDYEQGHKKIASAKGETIFRLSVALGISMNDVLTADFDICDSVQKDITEKRQLNRISIYENMLQKTPNQLYRLLSRSAVALDTAQYDYNKKDLDDCYLYACCYQLQQSIELSLKYMIEMIGQKSSENQNIETYINNLNKEGYHIQNEERIRNMASMLYSWKTESLYSESFTADNSDVENVFTIAKNLIVEAKIFLQYNHKN